MMGEIVGKEGVRTGYTGKWHLDGGRYNGYGKADGGFPQDWWYDGTNYVEDIGPEKAAQWKQFTRSDWDGMLRLAFDEEDCWGHKVADRAINFLETADNDPFLLCVAFDEPHGPFMCPRRFLEAVDPSKLQLRPNIWDDLEDKPQFRRIVAKGHVNSEEDLRAYWRYYAACNSYVDYEIGRILDTVERLHGPDTVVIFTTDHGEQMGSHGTWGKGYIQYEECLHTPLIVRGKDVAQNAVTDSLASQVDFVATICDLLNIPIPERTHGSSLAPIFRDPSIKVRDFAYFSHNRFGNDGESGRRYPDRTPETLYKKEKGAFYPMRGVTDGRYKLIVNLFETDELYDLQQDPYEMQNRITDPESAQVRDTLHTALITEMVQTGDPLRCTQWWERYWKK